MNTIDLVPLQLRAELRGANTDRRTVDLIFTTGEDVLRQAPDGQRYLERLSLDPAHVRLERLNRGAPLLNAHQADALSDQIGVVEEGSARLIGREGWATVRFSRRPDVEPIYRDVRDGILRNVSVGYRVHKVETSHGRDSVPVWTAIDWEPYEISLVPMGADSGARVRSDEGLELYPCEVVPASEFLPLDFCYKPLGKEW